MKKKLKLHVETLRVLQVGPTAAAIPGVVRGFLSEQNSDPARGCTATNTEATY
jgi:hypothetical protein